MKKLLLPLVVLFALALSALSLAQGTYKYEGTVPPEQAAAWGIGCIIGTIVFIIVAIVVEIIIIVWVYKDAKRRGVENPAIWIILIIFTGLIGLIIYLVVRPKEKLPEGGGSPPPTA